MADSERLDAARELVAAVLRGERTPENDPALFEDDLLYFQVTLLSREDAGWLEAALTERSYAATARFAVLGQASLPDATRLDLLEGLIEDLPAEVQGQTEGFLAFLRSRINPE